MTEQELKDLYSNLETDTKPVEYQEKPEEKQNFLPVDFNANGDNNAEEQANTTPAVNEQQQEPVNNTDTNNNANEPANTTPAVDEQQQQEPEVKQPEIKTLDDVYKTIEYIEQQKYKIAQQEQEKQKKLQQEAELKAKQEEEKNRPFESSLKDFSYNKDDYTPEEKAKMKAIEEVYGSDLEDYFKLKMKSYENKFVEMVKFIEKNQTEGLTKSISQYHNDINSKVSYHDEYVKKQEERENQKKIEEGINQVKEKHADFQDPNLQSALAKWIYEEQTDAVDQLNLVNLSKSSNPKHVIELFDKFKSAKGIAVTNKPTQNTATQQQQEEAKRKAQEEKEKIARAMTQNTPVKPTQVDNSGKKTLAELYKSMNI